MSKRNNYINLTQNQIEALQQQGCSAQDWRLVKVTDGFNPARLRNVQFVGRVNVGRFTENVKSLRGFEKPSGIYNATIIDCTISDQVRISNIGRHIANYDIGPKACIEDVATMQTSPKASFGNGVEVAVLNEAGGREVILFDELTVQFAYLMCLHRYRPLLIEKLIAIANRYVEKIRSDRGRVGESAQILSTSEIIDVNVGAHAVINASTSLVNGTILSTAEAPTILGSNVHAKDFIIAEGTSVTDAANLKKVFVGQGCRIGNQFFAENSLFFANCEAFLGEACSIFAAPYTVTHHKSTLLIACLFSFYNAGSGTNQSNHMYKLGPVHEGKLERGTKTGSFSYLMWPCRVGPFSVVLGKHTRTFDTSDFPFTHLDAAPNGKCLMIPGLHLVTVGTVRDEAKWLSRDRRKGSNKRDIISFDVLSPYTVGKMIKACSILKQLQDSTDKLHEEVNINGAQMKRVLLRTSQKYYRTGIEMYLLEKVFQRIEHALDGGIGKIRKAFAADADAVFSFDWVDIGGQLMPRQRLLDVISDIEKDRITTVDQFSGKMKEIYQAKEKDQWLWIKNTYKDVFDCDLEAVTKTDLLQAVEAYFKVKTRFLKHVLGDAEKEFDELSRTGFGYDGSAEDLGEDFRQVRGQYDENKFVKTMRDSIDMTKRRKDELEKRIKAIPE